MIRERVKTLRAGIGTLLAVGAAICIVTIMPAAAQNAALPLAGILGPDSKIAFHGDREGRDSPDEIYVISADGSGERRVTPTTDACNAINPRWSPNGHRIAFHCSIEAVFSEIYLIDADGTGMTQLTNMTPAGLGAAFATWSPKGNKIAFSSALSPNIYVVDVDERVVTQLTSFACGANRPDWSPDGRKLVFNSVRSSQCPFPPQVYVVEDIDHPDVAVRLTFTGTNRAARWSPDGSKITFESTRDNNPNGAATEIYVMNADGSAQLRLTEFAGMDSVPSFSPDGHWIVFHRQLFIIDGLEPPNGSDLFAVPADGSGGIVQLTNQAPRSFSSFASWAPGVLRPAEGAER